MNRNVAFNAFLTALLVIGGLIIASQTSATLPASSAPGGTDVTRTPTNTPLPTVTPLPTHRPTQTALPTDEPTPVATIDTPTPPPSTPLPSPTSPPPSPTPLKDPNLFYLPLDTFSTTSGEDNDSLSEAFPILPHMFHFFLPDDAQDWYQFDLESSGDLVVSLTNFQPQYGQISVYKQNDEGVPTLLCREIDDDTRICNNGTPGTIKLLNLGRQTPGHYYLFVSNDCAIKEPSLCDGTEPYRLYVGFPEE